ncbi:MAG TPA: polysaccharide biosynthesis/export family protein [Tepidisphaeraceae bacterium]|nr:polysaccharide biosynthesis/export family protein [Tepidisphaeraceae bacterium]
MRLRLRSDRGIPVTLLGHGMVLAALALAGGCDTKGFVDPTEMGRFKKDPLIMPIVSQVDPAVEEADTQWANASEPTPEDLKVVSTDYRISPNDMLTIQLSDLSGPNTETLRQTRVSESGNISLPYLTEPIRAAGLTEIELERAVVDAYRRAQLIEHANVSVTVTEARGRAFWISGAVGAPGQYPITQGDFRLFNALAMSRDVNQSFVAYTNVNYAYVVRATEQPLAPSPNLAPPPSGPATRPATGPSSDELAPRTSADAPSEPVASANGSRVVHLSTEALQSSGQGFDGFRDPGSGPRVIRIPLDGLKRGDLKYNIPIRPNDQIYVMPPDIGLYFVGGHVARPGTFQLTGQKVTLMDAIIGASMLDGLAIPQRTDVIRHVNPDHEVFVRVDLAKVFAGESPDIYIKPGDKILVGTNAIAPFLAAIRGGFRITYGFGFLYDRNYAYPVNNAAIP